MALGIEEEFLNHLTGAVRRSLRLANEAAVLVDAHPSTLVLAALVAEHADVPVALVHTRAAHQDSAAVRDWARNLNLDLVERVAVPAEAASPEDLTFRLREAASVAPRVLYTLGSADLRDSPQPAPPLPGLEARRPFADPSVMRAASRLHIQEPDWAQLAKTLGQTL